MWVEHDKDYPSWLQHFNQNHLRPCCWANSSVMVGCGGCSSSTSIHTSHGHHDDDGDGDDNRKSSWAAGHHVGAESGVKLTIKKERLKEGKKERLKARGRMLAAKSMPTSIVKQEEHDKGPATPQLLRQWHAERAKHAVQFPADPFKLASVERRVSRLQDSVRGLSENVRALTENVDGIMHFIVKGKKGEGKKGAGKGKAKSKGNDWSDQGNPGNNDHENDMHPFF